MRRFFDSGHSPVAQNDNISEKQQERVPRRAPSLFYLAAAAVIVAATAVAAAQQVAATAVAQQQDDQNDPANITAAETVIVTHSQYLRNFLR